MISKSDLETVLGKLKDRLAQDYRDHNLREHGGIVPITVNFKEGFNALSPWLVEAATLIDSFTLNEENRDRLDQVPEEQLRMLVLHMSGLARAFLERFNKELG